MPRNESMRPVGCKPDGLSHDPPAKFNGRRRQRYLGLIPSTCILKYYLLIGTLYPLDGVNRGISLPSKIAAISATPLPPTPAGKSKGVIPLPQKCISATATDCSSKQLESRRSAHSPSFGVYSLAEGASRYRRKRFGAASVILSALTFGASASARRWAPLVPQDDRRTRADGGGKVSEP